MSSARNSPFSFCRSEHFEAWRGHKVGSFCDSSIYPCLYALSILTFSFVLGRKLPGKFPPRFGSQWMYCRIRRKTYPLLQYIIIRSLKSQILFQYQAKSYLRRKCLTTKVLTPLQVSILSLYCFLCLPLILRRVMFLIPCCLRALLIDVFRKLISLPVAYARMQANQARDSSLVVISKQTHRISEP